MERSIPRPQAWLILSIFSLNGEPMTILFPFAYYNPTSRISYRWLVQSLRKHHLSVSYVYDDLIRPQNAVYWRVKRPRVWALRAATIHSHLGAAYVH